MATRVPAKNLGDEVQSALIARQSSRQTWYDRLPENSKSELAAIRERYRNGEFPGTIGIVATAIVEACKKRGIRTAGRQGVSAWLKRKD
jgi:hypothetical protein